MKKVYICPSSADSSYQLSGPVMNVEGSHQIESFNQKDMMNLGGDIGESSDAKTKSVLWSDGKDAETSNYDFKLW
jgi:hypothetical protein